MGKWVFPGNAFEFFHFPEDFRIEYVLQAAGIGFGGFFVDGEDVDEELLDVFMTAND